MKVKEKNMRLNPELCRDYDYIKRCVFEIYQIVKSSNPKIIMDWMSFMDVHGDDLRSHKIKLENMVSSTDCNYEKLELLRLLLEIEWLLSFNLTCALTPEFMDCCKMGLKIDPNEPRFNYRNLISRKIACPKDNISPYWKISEINSRIALKFLP